MMCVKAYNDINQLLSLEVWKLIRRGGSDLSVVSCEISRFLQYDLIFSLEFYFKAKSNMTVIIVHVVP